jgi:hypothetical protein
LLPPILHSRYKSNNNIEEKGVKIFSIFFIDIIKVTEVQYAILIMNCSTVEILNVAIFKPTISGYAKSIYLEKEIHRRFTQAQ